MKLLYVTSELPYSRSETFIIPEIQELQRRGHEVLLVPVHPNRRLVHADAQRLLASTFAQPVVSVSIVLAAARQSLRNPLGATAAALSLARSRSGYVLLKNLAVLPKALWLARIARDVGADHIHAHWVGTTATMAAIASRLTGIPWSFTAHRWDIAENNLIRDKARTAVFARAIDVRGGEELRGHMGEFGDKLVVIHMGVDLPDCPEGARAPAPGPLRVVMAAFFVEKKGHRYALEALASLRRRGVRVELTLAGDGPLLQDMQRRAQELGLGDAARFLGIVSHAELLDGLTGGRWDVALLPSIVAGNGEKEGIPVFLMEAMAAGLPVVATDTGGIPELVVEGAGVIVRQRDPEAIADALERLGRDPELRRAMGSRGRRVVHEEYAAVGSVDRLLAALGSAPCTGSTA